MEDKVYLDVVAGPYLDWLPVVAARNHRCGNLMFTPSWCNSLADPQMMLFPADPMPMVPTSEFLLHPTNTPYNTTLWSVPPPLVLRPTGFRRKEPCDY